MFSISKPANADKLTALNGGYHAAFLVGAIFAALAAALGAAFIRAPMPTGEAQQSMH